MPELPSFHLLTCALIIGVVVYKLVINRDRPPTPGLRHLLLFLLWLAVSLALVAPESERLIVLVQPLPNTARLLCNHAQLLAVYHMVGIAYSTQSAKPPRTVFALLLASWAAMTTLMAFSSSDLTGTAMSRDIFTAAVSNPVLIAYGLVFFFYATGCIAVFVRMISRYARQCAPGLFRSGLRTIVAAAVFSALWGAWSALQPLLVLLFGLGPELRAPVDRVLSIFAVVLWLVGSTMAWWTELLGKASRHIAAYRGYRAINPLWTELTTALPRIALTSHSRLPRNVEFALYRRVIEIRDGDLALRPHVPPDLGAWVTESARRARVTDTRQLAVLLEASSIAAALVSWKAGHRWDKPFCVPHQVEPCVESETAWLASVSRAFASSPVVAEIRGRTAEELAVQKAR
ncbi:MAB_1171c family putative transporter [Allokutzneria oryzae]|uniref:MAB_1171c family putative transporter n=1 Tax=Allokutzneria oryzae TaxID=1378989 RepID=A0ABV5ZYL5_9PSEU